MNSLIEFGRGPLFRLAFVLMLLGIARIIVLALMQGAIAGFKRTVPAEEGKLVGVPATEMNVIGLLWRSQPIHSFLATAFHAGFMLVPFFLAAHVVQWKHSVGFSWWSLPQPAADRLTLLVIIVAPLMLLSRLLTRRRRQTDKLSDYVWLVLLPLPFITGYLCVNGGLSATAYHNLNFVHIYAGNFLMLLIPFTSISQCVLRPAGKMAWSIGAKLGGKFSPEPVTE
jgi:hypothetical protein